MSFYIGCGMVLMQGDKYILVQETRGKAKGGLFNLPGGTLEAHEDLIDCVTREVQEETGVTTQPESFIGLYQTVIGTEDNVLFFIFSGHATQDAVFYSSEHQNIRAYTLDEVIELDAAGRLRAPSVLKSIQDFRTGASYPLAFLRTHRVGELAAIMEDKA